MAVLGSLPTLIVKDNSGTDIYRFTDVIQFLNSIISTDANQVVHVQPSGGGGGGGPLTISKNGTPILSGVDAIDFDGFGLTVSSTGPGAVQVNKANSGIAVRDEGSTILTATQNLNFVGCNVTVTAPDTVTVNIPGGGSSPAGDSKAIAHWNGTGTAVASSPKFTFDSTQNSIKMYAPLTHTGTFDRSVIIGNVISSTGITSLCFLIGDNLSLTTTSKCLVVGNLLTLTNVANSIVSGQNNQVTNANNCFVSGEQNQLSGKDNSALFGVGLRHYSSGVQVNAGKYNANDGFDDVFQYGRGTSDVSRKTVFAVERASGNARIPYGINYLPKVGASEYSMFQQVIFNSGDSVKTLFDAPLFGRVYMFIERVLGNDNSCNVWHNIEGGFVVIRRDGLLLSPTWVKILIVEPFT